MKVHFSHDSKNVDRQRQGTHGVFHVQRCWGWLGDCQKTHKWMCPQGHRSTECTYNVTIYSSFLCEPMHLLSVSVKRRTGLEPPPAVWPSVSAGTAWPQFPHVWGRSRTGPQLPESFHKHGEIMNTKISQRGWYACTVFSGLYPCGF